MTARREMHNKRLLLKRGVHKYVLTQFNIATAGIIGYIHTQTFLDILDRNLYGPPGEATGNCRVIQLTVNSKLARSGEGSVRN
jgi:hypothetical protein